MGCTCCGSPVSSTTGLTVNSLMVVSTWSAFLKETMDNSSSIMRSNSERCQLTFEFQANCLFVVSLRSFPVRTVNIRGVTCKLSFLFENNIWCRLMNIFQMSIWGISSLLAKGRNFKVLQLVERRMLIAVVVN